MQIRADQATTSDPRSRFYLMNKRDWQTWAFQVAAEMWRDGKNTKEIGSHFGIHESEVWNRLDQIKALS